MPRARFVSLPILALVLLTVSRPIAAQSTVPTTTPVPAPGPGVSGLIFGSYNFTPSTTPNQLNNQNDNAFVLDRAYLTVRAPVAEHMSVRVTTDVYQARDSSANAYSIRAKYAYLQYDGDRSSSGSTLMGRVGILQTVLIEHVEAFWPRYLAQTAVERSGYFGSSDVGLAGQYTMPNQRGEIYATITNGPGYASRERDRFKDFAARLSLTPLARNKDAGLLQTFTITPWIYKGATASAFVNGGAGQVGAVGEALDRTRYGLFTGIRDPRLVLAAEYGHSRDGKDVGSNTVVSPRTAGSVSGRLLSAFTVVRPFAFTNGTGKSAFAIVARYDQVKPTAESENLATPASSDNSYHTLIAGVSYDVNPRVTFAADYQESLAANNDLSSAPPSQAKGYFAHFSVAF
jgi:hypothetical protein